MSAGLGPGGLSSGGFGGTLTGNLTVTGTSTLGGNVSVTGDIVPDADNTRSLGSTTRRYQYGYLAAIRDIALVARTTYGAAASTIHYGAPANTGTNTAHSVRALNTLSGSTTIMQWHNDSAAAVAEFAIHNTGKLMFRAAGGADDVRGTATLVGGTVTVNTSSIRTGDLIFTSRNTPGGSPGFISAPVASIVDSTSFVINSSSGTDTSTVNWWIIT